MIAQLWFAFILLSLSYWKQLPQEVSHIRQVVICFHFTIFVVLETTGKEVYLIDDMLWFAFILLSLSYWKQHIGQVPIYQIVVICFHFTIFVVLETTRTLPHLFSFSLWFAFILLSLSYWKQQLEAHLQGAAGCDLLSFYYLCRTGNNVYMAVLADKQLWFAFILLSLSYWKQPPIVRLSTAACCDLLSFYYLCRTGNNRWATRSLWRCVVICFHFTIFVVLETTLAPHILVCAELWFAFILLSLSYWKQRKNLRYATTVVVICFHFTIFVVLETTT